MLSDEEGFGARSYDISIGFTEGFSVVLGPRAGYNRLSSSVLVRRHLPQRAGTTGLHPIVQQHTIGANLSEDDKPSCKRYRLLGHNSTATVFVGVLILFV